MRRCSESGKRHGQCCYAQARDWSLYVCCKEPNDKNYVHFESRQLDSADFAIFWMDSVRFWTSNAILYRLNAVWHWWCQFLHFRWQEARNCWNSWKRSVWVWDVPKSTSKLRSMLSESIFLTWKRGTHPVHPFNNLGPKTKCLWWCQARTTDMNSFVPRTHKTFQPASQSYLDGSLPVCIWILRVFDNYTVSVPFCFPVFFLANSNWFQLFFPVTSTLTPPGLIWDVRLKPKVVERPFSQ